ncbi:sodium/C4-dicarboxylate symporter, DctA [Citrifermentans bemidjiense Bem]|uniref:C4-dicarboxylate transport protein n=1 Tax=Citrifermentans bemidjiense (strain ATCC BAA-1014 / DSM 16622 / JCM 12645 / Bem) TaxID=404380 RepID=DCTA_CITBB|nr:dicarboxylate/amino acid:cation symporter [Citrifermentans bemidjiense]B5E9Q0.1 RecName: Full=C4-dicarboxylate transport protein [Citrifermentans bemidjiense Bem]ACH40224.1 sodium/C4-dicarboxylate symporter, DctA [Citrifermentans bemidjiense Bem]
MKTKKFYQHLYFQVLTAISIGVAVGYYMPDTGTAMKPLGDGFIKMIKMIITPIIFCTVVTGIAGMDDMKKVGRVGGKALLYFEAVSTLALAIGLMVINVIQPGVGMNADVTKLDTKGLATYTATAAKSHSFADFALGIIPNSVVDAFAKGEILQVLFFAILFGLALSAMGEKGKPVYRMIDDVAHAFFGVVNIIMKFAPIGAFGAMAFTIGKFGLGSLTKLGMLMGSFYLTCLLFIFVVLGTIGKLCGFNIFKFISYIKEELLIVLGTSSSESALPRLMAKLENLGCSKSVVGLVIPTGYSFNLDGTSIYLTMAAVFVAQATNTPLDLTQTLTILGVLMLTSKGAAGVTGSGFVTLAATFAAIPTIPVAGLALILGIDRFMSEARALTNLVGNGVATVVVSRWENELNATRMSQVLNKELDEAAVEADLLMMDPEPEEA